MATITGKNFSYKNFPDPATIPVADEYVFCNFMREAPLDVGGLKRGVRLFPGDDTPRIFSDCLLVNCEPPPNSTVVGGNTRMVEYDVVGDQDSVTIDGGTPIIITHHNMVTYGRYDAETQSYIDLPTPEVKVVD